MNFLAHLVLAGDNEGLRLGAMLGDFIRGRQALEQLPAEPARGVRLHRHIDAYTDSLPAVARLREVFPVRFRRYAGLIIDLCFDHELARHWQHYSAQSLEAFDREVRELLDRHRALVPERLDRFMAYADRRGLFAAYRDEAETLHSLRGIGRRLSRPNPLHEVELVWDEVHPPIAQAFGPVFASVQSEVVDWLRSKSTTTGS